MDYTKTVAIIGARACDDEISEIAGLMGSLLAENGYTIICGGLGGVMEAVCKGAKSKDGKTIGILPGNNPSEANPYIDVSIATGMGVSRNLIIIRSAVAVLAISGGYGTLSELAFALQLEKPVIGLQTWELSDDVVMASDPKDALIKLENKLTATTQSG
jgi:uncharacterized protein (TIGR00725 family)